MKPEVFMKIKNSMKSVTITSIKEKILAMPVKHRRIAGAGALGVLVLCTVLAIAAGTGTATAQKTAAADPSAVDTVTHCAITVDGKAIVSLADTKSAQAVLDGIAAAYQTKGSQIKSVTYAEKVGFTGSSADDKNLATVQDAITMILTGTKEPKTYTVQSGDSLWTIAHNSGMKVSELTAANPNADVDALKIGTTLNLFEAKPYIHVTLTERCLSTQKVAYGVAYQTTDTLYKGETRIQTPGTYGQEQVTSEIVKQNGKVISTTVVASQTISEPKSETVLKGSKSISSLVGTGSFCSPVNHIEISSTYGTSRGSTRRHTGVDLRNPKGTPIYVVDDGVVINASYQGTYGNLIKVSHGNGLVTYYGHCDTMIVSVGQVVKKGQEIGTVGITGDATGYHLHFEVRKNGVVQNPLNYL